MTGIFGILESSATQWYRDVASTRHFFFYRPIYSLWWNVHQWILNSSISLSAYRWTVLKQTFYDLAIWSQGINEYASLGSFVGFLVKSSLERLVFVADHRNFPKEEVKTYQIAPMSPLNKPTFILSAHLHSMKNVELGRHHGTICVPMNPEFDNCRPLPLEKRLLVCHVDVPVDVDFLVGFWPAGVPLSCG